MTIGLYTPLETHFSDIAEVVHIFYPDAVIIKSTPEGCGLLHRRYEENGWAEDVFTYLDFSFVWTTRIQGDAWEQKRRRKRGLKQACYYLLRKITGMEPPWGSLTGIRPTRLLYERLAKGEKVQAAREAMIRTYDLREDRAQLLADTALVQRPFIEVPENAVDIYVGIPFCKTRCSYCSFFAEAVGNGKKIPAYMDALLFELDAAARLVDEAGLVPRALYVGGGTPTAIDTATLWQLLSRMRRLFSAPREWTVEAGRPDTMSREMLSAIYDAGVTRVSVNPQTMNEKTLKAIGRDHTGRDTRQAYAAARKVGFQNINMDVIAALPGETARDFENTLKQVMRLAPDSLTVHTLARKHGSRLNEFGFTPVSPEIAGRMVEMGAACAHYMGMRPYYLYRQKYVAGNLENVAYALPGKECVYNIDIMEETTSILAVGAGAISKRVFPKESRIERAPNVGDIGHYISRVQEMVDRKAKLWQAHG